MNEMSTDLQSRPRKSPSAVVGNMAIVCPNVNQQ